jgi:Uma2 family endonuclease
MTIVTAQRMSLEEYLTYDDGTETRYELVDGVLVEMGSESTINTLIAMYLAFALADLGVPRQRFGIKQKIEVNSLYVSARDPDLIVHSAASLAAIAGRNQACLKLDEPNPMLVVEVVSPGSTDSENYQRDYQQKRSEYGARGIGEYWIVDPVRAVVTVLCLQNEAYSSQAFQGNDRVNSSTFPALNLTADQILGAKS